MIRSRQSAAVLLVLVAAASSVWVWQLRRAEAPPALVGPPRSDYLLFDFELVALDGEGEASFYASGPSLSRHPHLGTLDIIDPRFSSPDTDGGIWTSSARRAHINSEGTRLDLLGAAEVIGPESDAGEPIRLRSELLTVFPREQRVSSEQPVTITQPGSILNATGLRADLNSRRIELLSNVRTRHAPPTR